MPFSKQCWLYKTQTISSVYLLISSIYGLYILRQLKSLSLSSCNIETLQNIEQLSQLCSLSIDYNPVSDITMLSQIKTLKALRMTDTSVTDISPLKYNDQLEYLDYSFNQSDTPPPIWYIFLKTKKGKLSNYAHLEALPDVSKIWTLLRSKTKENTVAAAILNIMIEGIDRE